MRLYTLNHARNANTLLALAVLAGGAQGATYLNPVPFLTASSFDLPIIESSDPGNIPFTGITLGGLPGGVSGYASSGNGLTADGKMAGNLTVVSGSYFAAYTFFYDTRQPQNGVNILFVGNVGSNNSGGYSGFESTLNSLTQDVQQPFIGMSFTGKVLSAAFGPGTLGLYYGAGTATSNSAPIIAPTAGISYNPGVITYVTAPSGPNNTAQNLIPKFIDDAGRVAYTAKRNTTNQSTRALDISSNLGLDFFVFDPATGNNTSIGLTSSSYYGSSTYNGVVYDDRGSNAGSPTNTLTAMNGQGKAIGANAHYTSATTFDGYQGWLNTPGTGPTSTVPIGLAGSNYKLTTTNPIVGINAAGKVAGMSVENNSSNNIDGWLYTPGTSPGTANVTVTASSATMFYSDAAVGSYVRIGLIDQATSLSDYSGHLANNGRRSTTVAAINDAGNAAGTSLRYGFTNIGHTTVTSNGSDAWYYNGTNSQKITPADNPNGVFYNSTVGSRSSGIVSINPAYMVSGFTSRYATSGSSSTTFGQDAWVFDATAGGGAGATFVPYSAPLGSSLNQFGFSYVGKVSATGTAIGYYRGYNASSVSTSVTVFAWSETTGLQVLGSLPYVLSNTAPFDSGTSNSAGVQQMINQFTLANDGTIYGPAIDNYSTGALSTGGTGFLKGSSSIFSYAPPKWIGTASGSYSTAGNWSGGVAPSSADGTAAIVLGAISSAQTITVDVPTILAQITLASVSTNARGVTVTPSYTLASAGNGSLTLQGVQGYAAIVVASGSHTITAALSPGQTNGAIPATQYLTTQVINATDTLVLSQTFAAPSSMPVTIAKTGDGTLQVKQLVNTGVNIYAGKVRLKAMDASEGTNANATNLTSLTINGAVHNGAMAATATLDLATNDLVIPVTCYSTSEVVSLITSGYSAGTWSGTGIITGSAGAHQTVGYLSGSAYNALHSGSFDSLTYGANDTLIKFTYAGDATLQGFITIDSYLAIDNGYLRHLTGWGNGDFNYDGTIDYRDYAAIDASALAGGITLAEGEIALHAAEFGKPYVDALGTLGVAAVPEPNSLFLLAMGAAGVLAKRRR